MLRHALILAALFHASASVAAPLLTADRAVDAPVSAPALLDQETAAVAFGGGQYLAVWRDGDHSGSNAWTIRAMHVDLSGNNLDATPIKVSNTGATIDLPAVAYDGTRFLVVWADTPTTTTAQIYGAYVGDGGTVGARFAVSGPGGQYPSVSGGNGAALVSWTKITDATPQVHAAMLDNTGAIVKPDFTISAAVPAGGPALTPAVRFGGATASNFLVAWTEGNDPNRSIRAATVPVAIGGAVTAPIKVNANAAQAIDPAIASDGTKYLAIWSDARNPTMIPDLYGRTISFAGAAGGTSDFVVAVGTGFGYVHPQLEWVGTRFLAAWEALDDSGFGTAVITGGRLNASGAPLDGSGLALSSASYVVPPMLPGHDTSARNALATDGAKAFGVWTRQGGTIGVTGNDVFGQLVDPASTLLANAPKILGRGSNYQHSRAVASNGNVFLIVWEDDRGSATGLDIYGLHVDRDGKPVETAPFVICHDLRDQFQPAVGAIPGGDFLVAWADGSHQVIGSDIDLHATRVGATTGSKDDAFTLSMMFDGQLYPTVAGSPDGWLVAWEDWRNIIGASPDPIPAIYSTFISKGGLVAAETVIADSPSLSTAESTCAPSAAWNGKRFLVAYERPCDLFHSIYPSTPQSDVLARWVKPDGTPSDSLTLANLSGAESVPRLAALSNGAIVAEWRERDMVAGEIIRGALVTDDGKLGAVGWASAVAMGSGTREAPSLAVAPGDLVLSTWVDGSPPSLMAQLSNATLQPLGAAFAVTTDPLFTVPAYSYGVNSPPGDGSRAATPRATSPAGVAVLSSGEALVAYDRLEMLSGTAVSRVHYRTAGALPIGTPCKTASGCADGYCSGGSCCDAPCDGLCQACGANGCVEKPASDPRCGNTGTIACGSLSTECRAYNDVPLAACVAFGQCAEAGNLADCISFTDAPDGTACSAAACGGMGTCMTGACTCAFSPPTFPPRMPLTGCACTVGGGEPPVGLGLLLVAAILLLHRRGRALRRWLGCAFVLVMAGGCVETPSLDLTLALSDPILAATHSARVILSHTDGTSFPLKLDPMVIDTGLTVRNVDVDGDGAVDVVLDLGPDYPFGTENQLRLVPASLPGPINLSVRAEIYDGLANRFARLGGADRKPAADRLPALLSPGLNGQVPTLTPACLGDCPLSTWSLAASDALPPLSAPGEITALAAGNLRGATPHHADVIAAVAHADGPNARLNAGVVRIYLGQAAPTVNGDLDIYGALPGDQLGSAVAVGDLDGDGADDLVLGAPGAGDQRGAVYVIYGGADSFVPGTPIDLGTLALSGRATGASAGDRLGEALALADVDGDGKPEIIAGAPGSAAIFVLTLDRGAVSPVDAPSAVGPEGSGFGRALSAANGRLLVGAPLFTKDGKIPGAAFLLDLDTNLGAAVDVATLPHFVGEGGGFGSTLALPQLDGSGQPGDVVIGAPVANGGNVFVFRADAGKTVEQTASQARRTLRVAHAGTSLGDALAVLPRAVGDLLLVGAAGGATGGTTFVVHGPGLQALPAMQLGTDGRPAAAALWGAHAPGDGFGAHVTTGDIDGDGLADVAVVAGKSQIYLYRGPLL